MKSGLKILFLTAGGSTPKKELGLGHIFRSLNLASHFKKNDVFFLLEDFGGSEKIIKKNGYRRIITFRKNENKKNKTIKVIKKFNINLIIIDRYKIPKSFVSKIKSYVKTVVISDLQDIDFNADLVVNGFIGFKNQIIKNSFGKRCIVGPSFQILNKNFSLKKKYSKKFDLLATFGGYDEHNIIEIFLESLKKYANKITAKIILGPSTKKSKKIFQFEKQFRSRIKIVQETDNMSKEIMNAKFGICAGGITSYEFAAMNKPFAIVSLSPHQLIDAVEWEKKRIAINLGLIDKKINNKIDAFLEQIICKETLTKSKKLFIDGLGSERVAKEILTLTKMDMR